MIFPINGALRKRYDAIKDSHRVLLVGLTGGIASGKSTVAKIFEGLGSVIIDFDILARQVVLPGERAWTDIVEYFGEEVLLDNGEIDRKRLSETVFRDHEKRKRLEQFTHPAIGREFVRQVDMIASGGDNAIILAVVPLLIECGMQELFHSITVVYVSREKQALRLIVRDGITRDRADNIINAQMPIDDKALYADFIIYNHGTVEETMIQVRDIWDKLVEMKKDDYWPIPKSFTTR